MSDNKLKSTEQYTIAKEQCVREAVVTDQFKKVVEKAFEKTKEILQCRHDDLTAWGIKQQNEFSSIFGIEGKENIVVKYYNPGQQIDPDDAKPTPRNAPSTLEITAHDFMVEGVERLINICDKLEIGNRVCDINWGSYRYGNFLNETALNLGVARIAKGQTLNILPNKYKENIRIEILNKFNALPNLMGYNSQVSTLCHELSHLIIYKENDIFYGGMGTDDILPNGVKKITITT